MITSGYDQRKLIAADARKKGAGGRCLQAARDFAQQRITDRMPELVVGFLEAVEVGAKNRKLFLVCGGPLQRGRNSLIESRPVGQVGA